MIVLGIESTAHTFGVGIVEEINGELKILANEKDIFVTDEGGIIPRESAEHHYNCFENVLNSALNKSGKTIQDIDAISFSRSPGIGNCLRIGSIVARSLASFHNKPLIGINHCIAHLEIGRVLTDAKDPVLLYASGANTQVIAYEGGKYRIFGETLDNGIGNFLDSFARLMGFGFPGGPKVYELSLKSKNYVELPYSVKGMDVSFGGIYTNLRNKLNKGEHSKEDLCFSVQETVFAMLCEVSERALAHTGKSELLLGGGVACNKRLQEMAKIMCEERGAKCFILPNEYNVDNGAMIAVLGLKMFKAGITTPILEGTIDPYERTDDIFVKWE